MSFWKAIWQQARILKMPITLIPVTLLGILCKNVIRTVTRIYVPGTHHSMMYNSQMLGGRGGEEGWGGRTCPAMQGGVKSMNGVSTLCGTLLPLKWAV